MIQGSAFLLASFYKHCFSKNRVHVSRLSQVYLSYCPCGDIWCRPPDGNIRWHCLSSYNNLTHSRAPPDHNNIIVLCRTPYVPVPGTLDSSSSPSTAVTSEYGQSTKILSNIIDRRLIPTSIPNSARSCGLVGRLQSCWEGPCVLCRWSVVSKILGEDPF